MVSIDILTPAFEASRDLSREEVVSLCHQSLGVPEEDIVIHYITDDHIACKIKNTMYSLDFLESLSQQNNMLVEQVQRAGEALQAFHTRMIDDHATINDLKAQVTALRDALTTISMSSSSSNTTTTTATNTTTTSNNNNSNISTSSHHHPHLHHHHQQHHHSNHQHTSSNNTSSSSSSSSSSFPPPSPSSSSSSSVVRGDSQYWRSKYEEEYSVRKRYQDRFERIVASLNSTTLATGEERLSPRANTQHQQQIRYDLKPSRSHEVLSPQAFPSSSSMSNMLSASYPIPSPTSIQSLSTPSSPQRSPSSSPLLSVPPVTLTLPQDDFPTTKPSRININIPKLGLQNLTNNPPQSSPLSPHSPHSPNMPPSPHSPRSPNSHGGLRRRNTVQNFAPFVSGPPSANLVGGVAIGLGVGLGLSAGTLAPPGGGVGGVGGLYGLEDVFCRLCTCEIFRPLPHVEWVCACGHANIKHGGSRSPSQSPRALDI
eukprot:TRINITY_DN6205_c0_g1_i2.p1 TRINITY_DN6205_c0_g1~~TRINITY_DN6205_c0_g1_i2.p1  ORF type:complete len:485 (-),score=134.58 TRINITY_DN6205_c0_g1_i2:105-1559(-)